MNKRRLAFALLGLVVLGAIVTAVALADRTGDELRLSGNVDIREVNLAFRVGGRLKRLNVDEGARVQAGDVLGELDDQPYRIALRDAASSHAALQAHRALYRAGYRSEDIAQADAALAGRVAALRDAEQVHARLLKLAGTGATTERAIDDALAQRDQALAQVEAARQQLAELRRGFRHEEIAEVEANEQRAGAQLEQATLQLSDARLVAPSSGTIITRAAEPGAMLTPMSTVYTLSLDSPVWVRAYAAERELGRLAPGTAVKVTTDSRPQPYDGVVGFVSPTAEFTPKNVETLDLRTALVYRLRIVVSNPDAALRQGMPVTVRLASHG
jgi:HlyD family secretion protein